MYVRVMAMTAASIALAACSGRMPESDGYLNPNFWGVPVSVAQASATVSAKQDLGTIARSPDDTTIFGTHVDTAFSPGIWIFPPDELDGGQ
jgi:hypothetical protein